VQFHTNAMLITRDVAARLMDVGREYFVYLSIDGGHRRAHDANRGAGTFDKAVRGGHRLLDARDARRGAGGVDGDGAMAPHVTLYQLDLGEDEADYDETFLALAARADQWQRVDPIVRNGEDAASVRRKDASPSDWWGAESSGPPPSGPCFWAGYSLSVAPDGDVSVCILNQRARPDGLLGNLLREDASVVLARAGAFRDALVREGRAQVAHCRQCRKIEGRPRPPRAVDDLKRRIDLHVAK
jgi:sulfatase maturation enzyme AslB (radical SAM superfamily)